MQSNLSIEERCRDMSDNDATKAYENERFLNGWAARYQGGERGPRGMRSGNGHLLRSGSDVGGAADDHLVKAAGGSRRVCLHGWWSRNYGAANCGAQEADGVNTGVNVSRPFEQNDNTEIS